MPQQLKFMSAQMAVSTRQEMLQAIDDATAEQPVRIATPNPEFMLEASQNSAFRRALASMTHCSLDGSGLYFMLLFWRMFKPSQPSFEHYHGSDLVTDLFERYSDGSRRFFFLGNGQIVAQAAAALRQHYPQIQIVGTGDAGPVATHTVVIEPELLTTLKEARPDILLVGLGAPKQELWIEAAAQELSIPVMAGVGGSLHFYTDRRRAPGLVRTLHLEWLWRAVTEPGHWRRAWRAVIVFPFQALLWIIVDIFSPVSSGQNST